MKKNIFLSSVSLAGEKRLIFLKMTEKPPYAAKEHYSKKKLTLGAAGVAGAAAYFGAGALTVGAATASVYSHMKKINAEKKEDPHQKLIDNHVIGVMETTRDGVISIMGGLFAGTTAGGVIGGAAGLAAGKSKAGKFVLGATGAAIAAGAGSAITAGSIFLGLQKRRLKKATEKSNLIVNCEMDFYRVGKEADLTSNEIAQVDNKISSALAYINNSDNPKEDREKLWNILSETFPLQAPNFEDSSNPTNTYELFEQATVGLQKKAVKKESAKEVPSPVEIMKQLHQLSLEITIPKMISEIDLREYGREGTKNWTKNPVITEKVFNDEHNPQIKNQIIQLYQGADELEQNEALQALGGKKIYKDHIPELISMVESSALTNDIGNEVIFPKHSSRVVEKICNNPGYRDSFINEFISQDEQKTHITDEGTRDIHEFFLKNIGDINMHRIHYIDSIFQNFPDRNSISFEVSGKEPRVYEKLSNSNKQVVKDAITNDGKNLNRNGEPTMTQLKEYNSVIVSCLDNALIKELFRSDIFPFERLLPLNKDIIINYVIVNGNFTFSKSFISEKIKTLLSEDPKKLVEGLDPSIVADIAGNIPELSSSFISQYYGDKEDELYELLSSNQKSTFWEKRREENPQILFNLLAETPSLKIFNALPETHKNAIAETIENTPLENGEALKNALAETLLPPPIVQRPKNTKNMKELSAILNNNHTSPDEAANDDTYSKGGLIEQIKDSVQNNPIMSVATAKEALDTLKAVKNWVVKNIGKGAKAANDSNIKKSA